MRIFISWRGSDRELKNEIVEKLREAVEKDGDEVWESDGGVISDFSSECLTAVRESQIFVIIVSDECLKPSYVQNELIEAHNQYMKGNLNMLMFKTTDKELPPAMSMHLNHISDVYNEFRKSGNLEGGIDSLVKKVRRQLELRKKGKAEKPYEVDVPHIKGSSFPTDEYVVSDSRSDTVALIEEAYGTSNIVLLTGIDGYGRKTAAGEYIKKCREDYKEIIYLENFSGTLTELLLYGIEFTNLNEDAVDDKNTGEAINKIFAVLEKLEETTLLIVPSLTVGEKDERVLSRIRSELKMRFLMITDEIAPALYKRYPDLSSFALPVLRLTDENLTALFYHYYSEIEEDEKEELSSYIERFFSSVDGHTLTVKVAAETLEREGADMSEAVSLLEASIRSSGELEERIVSVLSSVFALNHFGERELEILCLTAFLCPIPIEYKTYKDIIDSVTEWDGAVYRHLVEIHWIDETRDGGNRYVSMKSFIAKCCRHNTIVSIDGMAKLFSAVIDEYVYKAFILSYTTFNYLKIAKNLSENAGWDSLSELLDLYLYFTEELSVDRERTEKIEETYHEALSIADSIEDKETADGFRESITFLKRDLDAMLKIKEISMDSLLDSMLSDRKIDEKYKAHELDEETKHRLFLFSSLLKSRTIREDNLEDFLYEFFSSFSGLNDEMTDFIVEYQINTMLSIFLNYNSDMYKTLIVTRAYVKASVRADKGYSENSLLILTRYFDALCFLTEEDEEIKDTFNLLISSTSDYIKNDFFRTYSDYVSFLDSTTEVYSDYLIKRKQTDDLSELFQRHLERIGKDRMNLKFSLDFTSKVFDYYISENMTEEGFEFLSRNMKELLEPKKAKECFSEKEDELKYEGLREALKIYQGSADEETSSPTPEDEDYYSRIKDYRNLRKYETVAAAAMKFDYSGKTREEILERKEELKRLATKNVSWNKIAPEAFALLSEAGYRVLGYRHHLVQFIGGAVIFDGNIAEIRNGEGKTYTILLAAFLHSIYGRKVTILDKSVFLTKRNYAWMRGVLEYLGLSVGISLESNYPETEFDVLYQSADSAVFCEMNNELSPSAIPLRHDALIIDEADVFMITDSHRPYILSSRKYNYSLTNLLETIYGKLEKTIASNRDIYFLLQKGCPVYNEYFYALVNEIRKNLSEKSQDIPDFVLNEIESICTDYVTVFYAYSEGKDYFIKNGIPVFENDDGTSATFSDYKDFFISKKENLEEHIQKREYSLRKDADNMYPIEYIRRFTLVSGATATATSVEKILEENYDCEVLPIPTDKKVQRGVFRPGFFTDKDSKYKALSEMVRDKNETIQPVLIVTGSTEESVIVSDYLKKCGVEAVLLNVENEEEENRILGEAGEPGRVTVTTALANRGVDIQLGGNAEEYVKKEFIDSGIEEEKLKKAIFGCDENEETASLREQYYTRVRIKKAEIAPLKKEIEELGGLCVIGTECFDDIRTEVQLEGRCARQGSPGECHFFYSIVDRPFGDLAARLTFLTSKLDDGYIGSSKMVENMVDQLREKNHERLFSLKYSSFHIELRERIKKRVLDIKRNVISNPSSLWYEAVPYIDERIFRFIKEVVGFDLKTKNLMKNREKVASALEKGAGSIANVVTVLGSNLSDLITLLVNELSTYPFPAKKKLEKAEEEFDNMFDKHFSDAFWNIFKKAVYLNTAQMSINKEATHHCNNNDYIELMLAKTKNVLKIKTDEKVERGENAADAFRSVFNKLYTKNLTAEDVVSLSLSLDELISLSDSASRDYLNTTFEVYKESFNDFIKKKYDKSKVFEFPSLDKADSFNSWDKLLKKAYVEQNEDSIIKFWGSSLRCRDGETITILCPGAFSLINSSLSAKSTVEKAGSENPE